MFPRSHEGSPLLQIDDDVSSSYEKRYKESLRTRPSNPICYNGEGMNMWSLAWGFAGLVMGVVLITLTDKRTVVVHDDSGYHSINSNHNNNINNNVNNPTSSYVPTSKYKKVQGMGFQIYTGGAPAFLDEDKTVLNPECVDQASYGQVVGAEEGDPPMMQCYLGLDDPLEDARKRVEVMRAAVERAYQVADPNPQVLKLFLAPEFFFRGVHGAYVFNQMDELDCGPICVLLHGLEEIVADKRFENWLFLMGTVIASETLPQEDPYDYLFYNFAPLYKGYDPAKMSSRGKRFLVPKRYVSSSDFLTPHRFLNDTLAKQLLEDDLPEHDDTVFNPFDFSRKKYDQRMWQSYKDELDERGYTMLEYDWLMVDGILMTCEICFDHDRRSALTTYLADIVTGRTTRIPSSTDEGLEFVRIPAHQAQISMVSSAGMTVTAESLALAHFGTIFLQDGLSNATNRMYWSNNIECDHEQGLQFEGGTEAVQRQAILSARDVFFEYRALHTHKRFNVYDDENWEAPLDNLFSAKVYPPQIVIYDPVKIPEVQRSPSNL